MTISMKLVTAAAILVVPVGAGIHAMRDQRLKTIRDKEAGRIHQAKMMEDVRRQQKAAEEDRKKSEFRTLRMSVILAEARRALPECRAMALGSASLKGKAVIWDEAANLLSDAQSRLPSHLQGNGDDAALTICFIVDRRQDPVVTYGNNPGIFRDPRVPAPKFGVGNTIGYRTNVEICAVHWPEKKAAGRAIVYGDMPPQLITRAKWDTTPVYGEINGPLANWVAGLK